MFIALSEGDAAYFGRPNRYGGVRVSVYADKDKESMLFDCDGDLAAEFGEWIEDLYGEECEAEFHKVVAALLATKAVEAPEGRTARVRSRKGSSEA